MKLQVTLLQQKGVKNILCQTPSLENVLKNHFVPITRRKNTADQTSPPVFMEVIMQCRCLRMIHKMNRMWRTADCKQKLTSCKHATNKVYRWTTWYLSNSTLKDHLGGQQSLMTSFNTRATSLSQQNQHILNYFHAPSNSPSLYGSRSKNQRCNVKSWLNSRLSYTRGLNFSTEEQ